MVHRQWLMVTIYVITSLELYVDDVNFDIHYTCIILERVETF